MDNDPLRVLLVEDDPDDYHLTSELLAELPGKAIELDWARDYPAAIEAIRSCGHDAYLVDFRLGKKNGVELVRESIALGCKAPMILLTGAGDREIALSALDAGAADYLVKGEFDAAALERSIRYSIRQARYAEELEQKADANRRDAEELVSRLAAIVANSDDAIVSKTLEGVITSWNAGAERIFGYAANEAVGKHISLIIPPERQAEEDEVLSRLRRGDKIDHFETERQAKDGRRLDISLTVSPVRDASGRIIGASKVARDMTERTRSERALRKSEEKYRSLFDSIEQGYCIIEVIFGERKKAVDYRFLEVNPAFEKQTGIKDAVGKSMREIAPGHEEIWYRTYGNIVKTGHRERFIRQAAALGRWYEVDAFRFGDPKNRQVAILFSDITERKLEENRLALFARLGEIGRTAADPDALLYSVSRAVGENFDLRRALFNEIDQANDIEIVHRDYCKGVESVAGRHRLSRYSSAALDEMKAGKTVVNFDSKTDERTARLYKKVYAPTGERAYVAVPLMRGGEWVASFWAADDKPRTWNDSEVRTIEGIAERAWLAVEKFRSEAALRESEERFSRFMDHLPGLAWIKDTAGRYVFANEAALAAFRTPPERLYGRTDDEVFPPDVAARFKENDEKAITDGVGQQMVEVLEQDDGVHHSLVTKFPIAGPDGKISLVGGMAIDITERQRMQEALRESEEKFRILSEAAPALIWFDDPEGNCLYVNQHYLEFAGKKADELQGTQWHLVLHPDDVDAYLNELHGALRGRSSFYGRVRAQRHDGEWRWLESFAQPLFAADGTYLGLVGVSPDITDSVEAEKVLGRYRDELEERVVERTLALGKANMDLETEHEQRLEIEREAVRLLKQLVTIQEDERRRIARDLHDDLGQKLTAVRLKLENAKKMCDDEPVCAEIDTIQSLAQSLDADIGFLAWELRPPALEDNTLTGALKKFVRDWSRFAGVVAEFRVSGLDRERLDAEVESNLYRIVQEALNNAHKYAKATNVSVLLERRKYDVSLIIEDDGVGFKLGGKANGETDGKAGGLGLLGMRERAALLGGELEVESSPGSGTTIFIHVPIGRRPKIPRP